MSNAAKNRLSKFSRHEKTICAIAAFTRTMSSPAVRLSESSLFWVRFGYSVTNGCKNIQANGKYYIKAPNLYRNLFTLLL